MKTLVELVQNLPAELFDEIYELVFTPGCDEVVHITRRYKPPVQLQVDRASRKAFSARYYDTQPFSITQRIVDKNSNGDEAAYDEEYQVIERDEHGNWNSQRLYAWLDSLGHDINNFPKTLHIKSVGLSVQERIELRTLVDDTREGPCTLPLCIQGFRFMVLGTWKIRLLDGSLDARGSHVIEEYKNISGHLAKAKQSRTRWMKALLMSRCVQAFASKS